MARFDDAVDAWLDQLDEGDEFSMSFRIVTRLPQTRIFPVASGTVTVTATAQWDRPSACRTPTYTIRLWRNVDWWFDDDLGARTFRTTGASQTATWTGLSSGDYYLEITVANGKPSCVLLGSITVT